jgi:hypothetical protein
MDEHQGTTLEVTPRPAEAAPGAAWLARPWWLGLIFVVVAAPAIVAAVTVHARKRMAAIEYVAASSGEIGYESLPEWMPESLPVPPWMETVAYVDARGMTPFDLRRIVALHEVSQIFISSRVNADCLPALRHFKLLEYLTLQDCPFSDAGMEALRDCRQLTELVIDYGDMTDDGLEALADLPLTSLQLSGTQITSEGLRHFKKMPLEFLSLNRTSVDDSGLGSLPLVGLELNRTRVTDAGLAEIARIRTLEHVCLDGTEVTDTGILQLAGLPLRGLLLHGTRVTPAGRDELQKRLPTVEIQYAPRVTR